jgi:hypothetical protein
MSEIAQRFCTSQIRVDLFRGLLAYRAELVALGFTGIQWIDGSFCEDCEQHRGKPPADIDLVNLVLAPWGLTPADIQALWNGRPELFQRNQVKARYHCDAFFLNTGLPAFAVHPQLTYWYGLFTHQRATYQWKGMLQVPLLSDDANALAHVNTLTFPAAP